MSRYILRAECSTSNPVVNLLETQSPGLSLADPTELVVFVGDKIVNNPDVSVSWCSGGLYVPQTFTWKNKNIFSSADPSKLFIDYQNISVTLSVDLQPTADNNLEYGTNGTTIPKGSLAVNLGSKGFQFNASNLPNGDEWGKLVYYEPGGLGIGWAFNANAYFPHVNNRDLGGRAMYLLGGLLPDVSYQSIVTQTGITNAQLLPSYNLQVGRDQALLSQMVSTAKIWGPQGYWSVQATNLDKQSSTTGRMGGCIVELDASVTTPTFEAFNPFGFLCLTYPTALRSGAQNTKPIGWNLQFPSYGLSSQDGYMMPGNCLSISPGAFFTDHGLSLLKDQSNIPNTPAITPSNWYEYWTNATSIIHLEETRPLYIEAPIFNAPVSLGLVPHYESGLSMLVPVTRICNGVYLYVPISIPTSDKTGTVRIMQRPIEDKNYFSAPLGSLQKWFTPKKVSLTINLPVIRIDTALQASRFFRTPYFNINYSVTVPVWIKFHYQPQMGPSGPVDPLSVDTTASLTQIAAASPDGVMNLVFTSRTLLERFGTVLAAHNQPVSNGVWGLSSLEVSRIMVSCTLIPDMGRIYRHLLNLNNFLTNPQGAIIRAGGTKVFGRCGPSLSAGAPSNMSVKFFNIYSDNFESDEIRDNESTFDIDDVIYRGPGHQHNDYFNSTEEFVFSRSVFLRVPDPLSPSDVGSQIDISFSPRPVLNMPFSGEVFQDPRRGGPVFTTTDATTPNQQLSINSLKSYNFGWFNNLNPFSPDYNTKYNTAVDQSAVDTYSFLDYKMVDFNRRKIEVWFELRVPVQIYTGTPFN